MGGARPAIIAEAAEQWRQGGHQLFRRQPFPDDAGGGEEDFLRLAAREFGHGGGGRRAGLPPRLAAMIRLAVRPYGRSPDEDLQSERLAQAAWPSLMIVLTACGPIILLSRQIMRSRPGDQSL